MLRWLAERLLSRVVFCLVVSVKSWLAKKGGTRIYKQKFQKKWHM